MIGAAQTSLGQGALRALADPTRRQIMMLLSQQDMTIGDVVDKFDMTRAAVKKHLTILESGGLVSVSTKGRERINHLEAKGLKSVTEWINYFNKFWDERLDALSLAINEEEGNKND